MCAFDSEVSRRVIADARAAFALRPADSTLLRLLEDSLDQDGPVSPRRLRFGGVGVTMCVVVTGEVGHAVLRVEASGIDDVFTVERSDGSREPVTGELAVGRGIIRVMVPAALQAGQPALHTDWFRL